MNLWTKIKDGWQSSGLRRTVSSASLVVKRAVLVAAIFSFSIAVAGPPGVVWAFLGCSYAAYRNAKNNRRLGVWKEKIRSLSSLFKRKKKNQVLETAPLQQNLNANTSSFNTYGFQSQKFDEAYQKTEDKVKKSQEKTSVGTQKEIGKTPLTGWKLSLNDIECFINRQRSNN